MRVAGREKGESPAYDLMPRECEQRACRLAVARCNERHVFGKSMEEFADASSSCNGAAFRVQEHVEFIDRANLREALENPRQEAVVESRGAEDDEGATTSRFQLANRSV